ncbi:DUF7319 domain-containing protein [Halococcus thailandensis]|uniref:DUF7319 domain-containing protein n=1 Tax=Halococcus thailandensis TaxID=335952 RepID=UPI001268C6E4|nr:hypothetical protein [Halococcus thailandensis]
MKSETDTEEFMGQIESDMRSYVTERRDAIHFDRLDSGDLIIYSDDGFAIVDSNGKVNGKGTIVEDVEFIVSRYLKTNKNSELNNNTNQRIQMIVTTQLLIGIGLIGIWVIRGLSFADMIILPITGFLFLIFSSITYTIQTKFDVE